MWLGITVAMVCSFLLPFCFCVYCSSYIFVSIPLLLIYLTTHILLVLGYEWTVAITPPNLCSCVLYHEVTFTFNFI